MSTEQSVPPPTGATHTASPEPSGGGARQAHLAATRQAEASGQLVAMSFPGARRVAGWLFWVVFPLLCLATIYTAADNVAHHLGKKPAGIRGTFVVQPRSCSQGFCSFGGLFTSDDHRIRNLPLLGDPRWHTADVHRVTYDPKSVEVTALPGHWDPTASVVATFGALTYLGALGYLLRERRRQPVGQQSAGEQPTERQPTERQPAERQSAAPQLAAPQLAAPQLAAPAAEGRPPAPQPAEQPAAPHQPAVEA